MNQKLLFVAFCGFIAGTGVSFLPAQCRIGLNRHAEAGTTLRHAVGADLASPEFDGAARARALLGGKG